MLSLNSHNGLNKLTCKTDNQHQYQTDHHNSQNNAYHGLHHRRLNFHCYFLTLIVDYSFIQNLAS